jgi:hypothetical protein
VRKFLFVLASTDSLTTMNAPIAQLITPLDTRDETSVSASWKMGGSGRLMKNKEHQMKRQIEGRWRNGWNKQCNRYRICW